MCPNTRVPHAETRRAWCKPLFAKLRDARPDLPSELTDRQQDGAEPLLAIADAAGGDWPEKARKALTEICTSAVALDGRLGVWLELGHSSGGFRNQPRGFLDESALRRVRQLLERETKPTQYRRPN